MIRAFVLRVGFCAAIGAMAACTLIGLDDATATPCLTSPTATTDYTAANATCAQELAASQPPGDCEAWVCGLRVEEEVFCSLGAPDADGDGVGDAQCLPSDENLPKDCDDSDRDVGEGLAERCDGKDNDCDGVVDEDLLVRTAVARIDEPSGSAGRVTFARSETGLAALLRREIGGQQALLAWRSATGGTPQRVGTFTLYDPIAVADDPGLAVALSGNALVGAFARNIAACPRSLVAARIDGTSASSNVLDEGLPDDAGQTCGSMPQRTDAQRAPAVAVAGSDVLLAWSADTPVGASLRIAGGRMGTALDVAGRATDLGPVVGGQPAALLGLPSLGAFLLAAKRATGIELYTVTLATDRSPTLSGPLSLPVDASDIAFARGVEVEGEVSVAVVYRTGDGSLGRVAMQRLVISNGGGIPEALGAPTPVADQGMGQGLPSVAWGETPRGWLVAWVEGGSTLQIQLLQESEGFAGDALSVFSSADVAGESVELRFGEAITASNEGGFAIVTHATSTSTALEGLHEIAVACGGSS